MEPWPYPPLKSPQLKTRIVRVDPLQRKKDRDIWRALMRKQLAEDPIKYKENHSYLAHDALIDYDQPMFTTESYFE